MRIGVDVRPLQNANRFRGIGRYTAGVLLGLAERASQADVFVVYHDPGRDFPELPVRLRGARRIPVAQDAAKDIRFVRRFVSMLDPARPQAVDVDVFVQFDPWGGIGTEVPTVAVFYDAIPLLFAAPPQRPGWREKLSARLDGWQLRGALRGYRDASRVATLSESSQVDYLRLVEPGSERIAVIGSGGLAEHGDPPRAPDPATLRRLGLTGDDFLLYVGGVDRRKNVVQLLRDLSVLRRRHPGLKLVLVGNEFTDADAIGAVGWDDELRRHPDLADSLVITGFVEEKWLPGLYAAAQAFVFPSRYEGFGLPVLEAMQFGCPVVCYDNSSLPEVAGDAALTVPDGAPMAPTIQRLLEDAALRDRLATAGRQRALGFDWDLVADRLLVLLAEARCDPQRRRMSSRAWRAVSDQLVTRYSARNRS